MTVNLDYSANMRETLSIFALDQLVMHRSSILDPVGAGVRLNARVEMGYELARQIGSHANYMLHMTATMAKGETVQQTRTVEQNHEFKLFATWWDHLKYDLQKQRVLPWLPKKWTSKLEIRYQVEVRKTSTTHPVAVTMACPHALLKWDGPTMRVHLAHLFPSRICDKCGELK